MPISLVHPMGHAYGGVTREFGAERAKEETSARLQMIPAEWWRVIMSSSGHLLSQLPLSIVQS